MQFKDIYGQEAVKERLLKSVREGRIPHAQLICGPQGTQKLALALAFAQYVNCKNRTETDSCGICPSCKKISALIHPDLHFAYPIVKKGDKDTTCSEYAAEWREMVTKHSPFTLSQWLDFIGAENKQAVIYANESEEINNTLSQKAYEGGYKTMVIWLPEKMHVVCANKLLKTIEEPLGKTLFLLVSNNAEEVLGTILSRTQRIPVAPLCEEDIRHFLQDRHPNLDQQTVSDAAHLGNGSLTDAEGSLTGSSDNREYFITLPKNYDNKKPYKLLFAMHCMGSNAEDFVHHYADQDHPSPYYGQQKLDTEGNYIFVSPRGDTDGMPWSVSSDKDHVFINQLLTTLEENYCIDTSRVFMTGFSFGAMVTNSMAQDMQDRLRAVAVYATADYNIYLPKNKGLPIAWMAVHGKNDGTCQYNRARDSALKRILKNNGKADADGNFTDASAEKPKEVGGSGHLCYDFTTVDERFPVKFCSWNGQHQWTAYDNGNWQNTWVPEEVHKFFEQF